MITVLSPIWKTEKSLTLAETLKSFEARCMNCTPLSPLECINRCQVYKLKNELRHLWEAIDNPNYLKELFNALKNDSRLCILKAISKGRHSVSQLQQELKKAGHSHSQENINIEYLHPLITAGLASVSQDKYYATTFGMRIVERLGCFSEFADKLPSRSECYEETLLQSLLSGPKTFKEIKASIPPKEVSRTLKRLRSASVIKTPDERGYVFFFKSKRDRNKENLTATEQEIYDVVADGGITAGKIAKKTGLCIRRTYKYIRSLKGKKLVFTRRTPRTYGLTKKGEKLASVMLDLQRIVEATWNSSQQVMQESKLTATVGGY